NVKIGAGHLGQRRLWTTTVRRIGNCSQRASGQPGSPAFVSRNRTPATCAEPFATTIDATTNRSGPGNHNQSGSAVGRTVQGNVSIRDHFNVAKTKWLESLAHAFAQLFSSCSCHANLCL